MWVLAGGACWTPTVHAGPDEFLTLTPVLERAAAPSGVLWRAASGEDGSRVLVLTGVGSGEALRESDLLLMDGLMPVDGALRLEVGRRTSLRDGGVDEAVTELGDETLAGYVESDGEFDLYDLALGWRAVPGPVSFELLGGVKAIRADVGTVTQDGDGGTTLQEAQGFVAVPVVGGSLRLALDERLSLVTSATTHALSDGATYLDATVEAALDFTANIGLTAGYQYVRSTLRVRDVDAELDQSGLFARLTIRF